MALETRGYDHEKLSRRYEERQLLFPYALRDDGTQWMRIAVAYYLLKDELDRALDLLRECAG